MNNIISQLTVLGVEPVTFVLNFNNLLKFYVKSEYNWEADEGFLCGGCSAVANCMDKSIAEVVCSSSFLISNIKTPVIFWHL